MHIRWSLFLLHVKQPRALWHPGVFRPLQLLTGKGCVHQWVVACEQASAARPRIKGLMFDVTSRAEVTNLRLHTKHCLLLLTYSVIKIIYGRASGYVSLQNNRKCMSCFGLSRSKELCFYFFFSLKCKKAYAEKHTENKPEHSAV